MKCLSQRKWPQLLSARFPVVPNLQGFDADNPGAMLRVSVYEGIQIRMRALIEGQPL